MSKCVYYVINVADVCNRVYYVIRSEVTSTSFDAADESSSNTDDSPRLGRRKTVMRLTRKKKRQEQKGSNLANKFMER